MTRLEKMRTAYEEMRDSGVWEDYNPVAVLDLVEVVEAAAEAVVLTYDSTKTTAQNDEYQRRARRFNEALGKFGFGPRGTPNGTSVGTDSSDPQNVGSKPEADQWPNSRLYADNRHS